MLILKKLTNFIFLISMVLGNVNTDTIAADKQQLSKKVTIKRIQDYLNGIKTFQATIHQTNPNQAKLTGKISINRETTGTYGKLRIQYDQKDHDIVVADGTKLALVNPLTKERTEYEIDQTPAAFLLQKKLDLEGDYTIKSFKEKGSEVELTMTKFGAGDAYVTLRFSTEPMLKFNGWTILDMQGNRTDVALSNVVIGITLNSSLFSIKSIS